MSADTHRFRSRLSSEVCHDLKALDVGCRSRWGITALMFRTAKYLFYVATLAMTAYLVEYAQVEPLLAMAFAILLISGPEGLEAWLIRTGQLQQPPQQPSDGSGDTKNDD